VFRERLLLALGPVFVEAPLQLDRNVVRPNGRRRFETVDGLTVADDPDPDHRWAVDHRHRLESLLLVQA
jgi:hypothetical protein